MKMNKKEATARIKINKLLEAAGWRFFPEEKNQPIFGLSRQPQLQRLI